MKKKYIVELDDNEVLIKHTIDKSCMDDFLGRTAQLTDYVCGIPMDDISKEEEKKIAEAMIEDSVFTALESGKIRTTYEVIASPIKVEKFLNGEYSEYVSMYIGKKVQEIVDYFTTHEFKIENEDENG